MIITQELINLENNCIEYYTVNLHYFVLYRTRSILHHGGGPVPCPVSSSPLAPTHAPFSTSSDCSLDLPDYWQIDGNLSVLSANTWPFPHEAYWRRGRPLSPSTCLILLRGNSRAEAPSIELPAANDSTQPASNSISFQWCYIKGYYRCDMEN